MVCNIVWHIVSDAVCHNACDIVCHIGCDIECTLGAISCATFGAIQCATLLTTEIPDVPMGLVHAGGDTTHMLLIPPKPRRLGRNKSGYSPSTIGDVNWGLQECRSDIKRREWWGVVENGGEWWGVEKSVGLGRQTCKGN